MSDCKTRPILFSAPMVRALLDGSKTQTRRVAKLTDAGHVKEVGGHRRWHPADPEAKLACPYGQPSDQLWVREAWRATGEQDDLPPREVHQASRIWFEADNPHQPGFGKLRPSMFMPRWASRITLEVTGVRVERLWKITEADAMAEGAEMSTGPCPEPEFNSYTMGYWDLWESINGPGSWNLNPFVWVVEFKAVQP